MIKRYLDHVRGKEPHERRAHALRAAGLLTGLFAVAWLVTLPARLDTGVIADRQSEQAAAAAQALYQESPHLEVASTTGSY